MDNVSETVKIARLGLMTAATVVFYLQIGPWVDIVFPLVGCILRPMIVVFLLTSFFLPAGNGDNSSYFIWK